MISTRTCLAKQPGSQLQKSIMAGLWTSGSGVVHVPGEGVFFLPQLAFMPLGSLRDQLLFPGTLHRRCLCLLPTLASALAECLLPLQT